MTFSALVCAEAGTRPALRRAVVIEDTRPQASKLLPDVPHSTAELSHLVADHPEWDEPVLLLAQALRAQGDWSRAEAAYRRALTIDPERTEALTALGAHLATTAPAEARTLLSRACARPDATWEAWHALGVACLKDDDPVAAVAALDGALSLVPDRLDILLLRGEAACAAGAPDAEFERLAARDLFDPMTLVARATMLEAVGQGDAALDELEAAVAIAPGHGPALAALGSLLAKRGRTADAERVLRSAVEVEGGRQARLDLANLLMRRQHAAEALALFDELLDGGLDTTLLCNRAVALCSLGRQEEAAAAARQAGDHEPESFLPLRALSNILPYTAGATGASLRDAAVHAASRLPRGAALHRRHSPTRLRIGLLSGSLRTHPVGWLTLAGFEHLDRSRFDLVCLGPAGTDTLSRRFAACSSGWFDTTGLSDPALAALARDQVLDIVVDAGGHGDTGRMAACAHRLAPVQAKWVGMQNATTGLPEMDWIITDRWETPPDLAHLYTERLASMPDGYVCYTPPPYAPNVSPLPASMRGHVTFGCFHNLSKVTPAVIAAWSAILRNVPGARLVLKNHQMDEAPTRMRLGRAFATEGVVDRVEFRGASGHQELLGQYADVDIALDTFPYGGGLTTCEALWMGVPTVTLPGDFFAARHSLSHLSNAGLAGWDAPDVPSFVALACSKASQLAELSSLRAGLRDQVRSSPLCDAPRFGRNLGALFGRMWEET